ncbi:MAG: hypothetical protein ACI3ZP_06710, partial [Candidatus Cryptobacteroides sp.]
NCSIFDGNHCSNLDGSGHTGDEHPWAGLINGAVDALIDCDLATAFSKYEKLIQDDSSRNDFIRTVTGGLTHINAERLGSLLVDLISERLDDAGIVMTEMRVEEAPALSLEFFRRRILLDLKALVEKISVKNIGGFYEAFDKFKRNLPALAPYLEFSSRFGKDSKACDECRSMVADYIVKEASAIYGRIEYLAGIVELQASRKQCARLLDEVHTFAVEKVRDLYSDDNYSDIITFTMDNQYSDSRKYVDHSIEYHRKHARFTVPLKVAAVLAVVAIILSM